MKSQKLRPWLLPGITIFLLTACGVASTPDRQAAATRTATDILATQTVEMLTATPSKTPTPTQTFTPVPPTFTPVPSSTPRPTNTSTPTPTDTPYPTPTPTPTPTFTPTTPPPTATPTPGPEPGIAQTRSVDGMVMVYVPAGRFQMGSTDNDRYAVGDEKPQHEVTLTAFWIDQTEVTNAQYAGCVGAGICQESAYAGDPIFNGADHPVVGVSWQNSAGYCQWVGGRLPTEAEWEYAARGPNSLLYPWGDTFDLTRANVWGTADKFDYVAPVASFPEGKSWVGAMDMGGNVWEWVADWYDGYPNTTYESDYFFGTNYKVLRGGAWDSKQKEQVLRPAYRYYTLPDIRHFNLGFRCVVPEG